MLDLFCGAGGAGRGYANAGFRLHGVDIRKIRIHYPYEYTSMDAITFLETQDLSKYTAFHASPPCQPYSKASRDDKYGKKALDMLPRVRQLLKATGKPYIIENVEGAPLRKGDTVKLCGSAFPPLKVIRHRLFESNIPSLKGTTCAHDSFGPKIYPRVNGFSKTETYSVTYHSYLTVVGNRHKGDVSAEVRREAMGIDWEMSDREVVQAIPPPYTEYLGKQLMEHLGVREHAKQGEA
jgi:DNA (cytosine-5)-methyltransferase 1